VRLNCPLKLCAAFRPLSWFECLAALQATSFVAWRDESTEWTHPLGREIAIVRIHPKHLPQGSGDEGPQAANTDKDGMQDGVHW